MLGRFNLSEFAVLSCNLFLTAFKSCSGAMQACIRPSCFSFFLLRRGWIDEGKRIRSNSTYQTSIHHLGPVFSATVWEITTQQGCTQGWSALGIRRWRHGGSVVGNVWCQHHQHQHQHHQQLHVVRLLSAPVIGLVLHPKYLVFLIRCSYSRVIILRRGEKRAVEGGNGVRGIAFSIIVVPRILSAWCSFETEH